MNRRNTEFAVFAFGWCVVLWVCAMLTGCAHGVDSDAPDVGETCGSCWDACGQTMRFNDALFCSNHCDAVCAKEQDR